MRSLAGAVALVSLVVLGTPVSADDYICNFRSGEPGSDFALIEVVTVDGDNDWVYLGSTKTKDGKQIGFELGSSSAQPPSAMSIRQGIGMFAGGGYWQGTPVAFNMFDGVFTLTFVHQAANYTFVYDCDWVQKPE